MITADWFAADRQRVGCALAHAMAAVPAYRDRRPAGLDVAAVTADYASFASGVPVLEKLTVRDEGGRLIADGYDRDDLHVEMTSGTEGRPIKCYMDRTERLKAAVDLWKRRRWWVRDLAPRDPCVRFYAFRPSGDDSTPLVTDRVLKLRNEIHVPLFDMSEERLVRHWADIVAFAPRWMHGPSTAICTLARAVRDRGLSPTTFELVELNGETVTADQAELVEGVFGCPVSNNYGCRELWTLAYSCRAGVLHAVDSSVFVEAIPDTTAGHDELVVTSLRNRAWPLIRYRIGDIGAVVDASGCACGVGGAWALKLERGRRADFFSLDNGQRLNAIMFSGIIRGLSAVAGKPLIAQYQARKTGGATLEVLVRLHDRSPIAPRDVLDRLDVELRRVLQGGVSITYAVCDAIPVDARTGKARDFVDLTAQQVHGCVEDRAAGDAQLDR